MLLLSLILVSFRQGHPASSGKKLSQWNNFFLCSSAFLCLILAFEEKAVDEDVSCLRVDAKRWHAVFPMHEKHPLLQRKGSFVNPLWYNDGLQFLDV